jgi:hypothetical protein
MTRAQTPVLDGDAFDAAWPLLGLAVVVPSVLVSQARHRLSEDEPSGPVDEGYARDFGCEAAMLVIWMDKASGAPAGLTCEACGAGQLCGVGQDHPATRLVASGFRCETH